jgi:hypothetical protein
LIPGHHDVERIGIDTEQRHVSNCFARTQIGPLRAHRLTQRPPSRLATADNDVHRTIAMRQLEFAAQQINHLPLRAA